MFILVSGEIYKILRKEVVAVGTHSHSKTKLITQNIMGGGEKVFTYSHQDKVEVPDIEHRVGQVISKSEKSVTVMDTKSYETLDVDASPEIIHKVKEDSLIFFFTCKGASTATRVDRE
jgi:translation initiation factor 5A